MKQIIEELEKRLKQCEFILEILRTQTAPDDRYLQPFESDIESCKQAISRARGVQEFFDDNPDPGNDTPERRDLAN